MNGMPQHLKRLFANFADTNKLMDIHERLTGTERGRRWDVDILNKSAIVLVVACWEAFLEDLAELAFDFMLSNAQTPSSFPKKVLVLAGREIRTASDERRIWELAGTGWQDVVRAHRARVVEDFLGGFHTPRPSKVDALFDNLLGYKGLPGQWRWHKNRNDAVLKRFETLIDLRGRIAHRVSVNRYVKKSEVVGAAEVVRYSAVISSNRIRTHLHDQVGEYPWAEFTYNSAA